MTEYLGPGVYVDETSKQPKPIEGVPTSTAGFIGPCRKGPIKTATLVTSLAGFERIYGGDRRCRAGDDASLPNYTWHAVRAFFKEGGRRLYIARVRRWNVSDCRSALKCFEPIEGISIVAAPGSTFGHEDGKTAASIAQTLIEHAERMRYRFAVLDSGPGPSIEGVSAMRKKLASTRAALYYPWVRVKDPAGARTLSLPPSGFVAGIYARNDLTRGASKPPANEAVTLATGLDHDLTEPEQARLSEESINCIRAVGPRGYRVWGGRTLSADSELKYVSVRRLVLYLEASIDRGTQWAVFEPNGERLWAAIRAAIENFLMNEWRTGSLPGTKPEQAFFVRCDRSTMTQADLDQGRLVCVVGVAPVRPAEFVVIRIGQWTTDRPRSRAKRRRRPPP